METEAKDKPLEPISNAEQVTKEHFEHSLKMIDSLAVGFKTIGTELANAKKRAPLRVLEAILFETPEHDLTFGKKETFFLALCREIMYHRQIIEIYLMKAEASGLLKEIKDGKENV
jgi:hypothetical protein